MTTSTARSNNICPNKDPELFESIARDIAVQGYSIHPNALPATLLNELTEHLHRIPTSHFKQAGIGREQNHRLNNLVRSDTICWINDKSVAEKAWLHWTESLRQYINRRIFMGLSTFESHFAHYSKGSFYKTHLDTFKGKSNRVLSLVLYLNQKWSAEDGGELVIYTGETEPDTVKVTPDIGTLVVFLSEEIPHKVLAAKRDRYSIAGWFRTR